VSFETATVPFTVIEPVDANERPPKGLNVELVYEADQRATEGLRFSVSLHNTGAKPITLHNPYDVLTYSLGDAEGYPLGLPAPASRLKVRRATPDLGRRKAYLDVIGIWRDGERLDADDELIHDELSVGGGERYSYDLVIRRVRRAQADPEPVDIGRGQYRLQLMVLLRTTSQRSTSAILETPEVRIRLE